MGVIKPRLSVGVATASDCGVSSTRHGKPVPVVIMPLLGLVLMMVNDGIGAALALVFLMGFNGVGALSACAALLARAASMQWVTPEATNPANAITSPSNGIITTGTGLPCLVCDDTVQLEVQPLPTKSGLFSCPDSKVNCSQPTASQNGYGQGAAYREDAGVTSCTSSTPCPPVACDDVAGGFFNVQLGT